MIRTEDLVGAVNSIAPHHNLAVEKLAKLVTRDPSQDAMEKLSVSMALARAVDYDLSKSRINPSTAVALANEVAIAIRFLDPAAWDEGTKSPIVTRSIHSSVMGLSARLLEVAPGDRQASEAAAGLLRALMHRNSGSSERAFLRETSFDGGTVPPRQAATGTN